jgi:hypothetical protein
MTPPQNSMITNSEVRTFTDGSVQISAHPRRPLRLAVKFNFTVLKPISRADHRRDAEGAEDTRRVERSRTAKQFVGLV